jgi:LPS-assembly protein
VIDYRLRLDDPVLGGRVQLQANTMAITRTSGQDTQRAFVGAEWNLRRLTDMGQEVTLTAYGRGDIYHSDSSLLTPTIGYRGKDGWQQRAIVAAAADMRWPFIGPAFNGTQRITPRLQIVAAPKLSNLSIPNEDSRSVELEDSNIFALNRFPGYDRFEDSTRLTYGMEYALTLPDFTLSSIIGQSYRLNQRATLLPDGTGLSSRLSDFVGRSTLRYRDLVSLTHRFRLDKDNLAIRRNELEATVGTKQTYATVSYLHLNRNITAGLEDLQDHEEVRVGVRAQIAKFWSIFGFTAFDLTTKKDNPKSLSDGFETVRHRAGIDYRDDCLNISLTWRREYLAVGDARANNSFQLRLAFRNLGI